MHVLAALLAAGGGSRFRGPRHKLAMPLPSPAGATQGPSGTDGAAATTVFERSCAAFLQSGAEHLAVVTGAIRPPMPSGVVELHNGEWAAGQATSVALVVEHARALVERGRRVDAVVIGLADQPFVTAEAWRAVIAAPADAPIVVATYDGRRGPHPVRLSALVWPLLPRIGDDGARSVLRDHPDWVLEVPCPGTAADIDTWEDLARWTSS